MVVNGHAEEAQREVARCDAAMRNDAARCGEAAPHDDVVRCGEVAPNDCATLSGDTILRDVAFLEHDRAASYDDYMPYPAYPIDDIPLVPEALEVAMQQGYRPRYEGLNKDQRRAFRSLVEMACAITPSTTMLDMDRSDAYLAWCAFRRDFPEFYWMSSLHLDAEAEGTVARATYQEPFARRGRPYLLFDLSLHAVLTDVVLANVFDLQEEDVQETEQGSKSSNVLFGTPNEILDDTQDEMPGGPQPVVYALFSEEERVRRIHQRLLQGGVLLRGNLPRTCHESVRERDRVLSEWTALDMKYLCDRCAVDCQVVWGTRGGFLHAWNVVRVGGRWLHVDVFADRELAEAYLDEHQGDAVELYKEVEVGVDECVTIPDFALLEERVPEITAYLLRTDEEMSVTYDWRLAGLLPYL